MYQITKDYLKWFIPMSFISFIVISLAPIKLVGALGFVASIIVPVDRIRVAMLKRQESIPKPRIAWRLIGLFSLMPIFLAFYTGLNGAIPEDTPRVSFIVNCVVLFWGIPFIFYCILFFNKNTWAKGLKKYARPTIENT